MGEHSDMGPREYDIVKNKLRRLQGRSSYMLRYLVCRPMTRPSQSQYKVLVAVASHICSAYLSGGKLYPFEVRFDRRLRTPFNGTLRCNGVSPSHLLLDQRVICPFGGAYV